MRGIDIQLPKPLAQRVTIDAEPPRGLQLIAADIAQDAAKQRCFDDRFELTVEFALGRGTGHLLACPIINRTGDQVGGRRRAAAFAIFVQYRFDIAHRYHGIARQYGQSLHDIADGPSAALCQRPSSVSGDNGTSRPWFR